MCRIDWSYPLNAVLQLTLNWHYIFLLAQRRSRTCFLHSLTTGLWERKCAEYMATVSPVFNYPWKGQSHGFIRQLSLCLDSAVCIQMNLSETSKQSHTKICTDWNGLQFKATTVHTEISQKHLRFGVHLPTGATQTSSLEAFRLVLVSTARTPQTSYWQKNCWFVGHLLQKVLQSLTVK